MTGQSIAIILVIFIMAVMFLRTGRKTPALLTFPLFSVPAFYLAAVALFSVLRFMGVGRQNFYMGGIIAGGILGAAACAILSRMILSKRAEKAYLAAALVFQAALAIGYVIQIFKPT